MGIVFTGLDYTAVKSTAEMVGFEMTLQEMKKLKIIEEIAMVNLNKVGEK